ncbi:glucan phosphoethanolaminetransferase (alkaline phosphatase superfamily) [Dysgonomonas sp. PFB1-18]|uniref:phosphoethanolamine transferase n=1 Tax=unclassified Dysgonomonas TaxID=2630389 RepID=UPI0024745E77|nr:MULTISPECIES: phosphoethanolamine transferase [unclassified Dysgonomonas]MDL2302932.1 phosphoethanolamine transferase [Dysgonomonas sp. OttesenSCG-928-D17]MDH6309814.1 glucan phosphoethanolaminetransferase (alkaline phosphatase superfamily) [Dysgonomonas sp. PF1-14]MDH6339358.1 glucan phosphoethanolaminetransferase (alkaline phosphatase superfamily) [Dysgonomonas sp. PF1-16]MDH6380857.1 glucan phosphoethanolaminetransferase (alkaline phosphatase superfamily) [Dysgonomonas sp. PFB1-18]MDH639
MSKLQDNIKRGGKSIYKYKFTILTLLYIGLIAFIPIGFAFSVSMMLLIVSFLFLLNVLAKTKYTFVLTFLLAFILTFNAYFAFILRSDVSLEIMASIFETHMAEAVSMLKGGVLFGGLIGLVATTALLYFTEKELKESKLSIKVSLLCLAGYLLLFLPFVCYKRIKWMEEEELFTEEPVRVIQDKVNLYAPILYGNIWTIVAYQVEMSKLRTFADQSDKTLPEGITLNDTVAVPEKIYLVIGESAYRNHWSLYGYPVKTTPFVDSLSQVEPKQLSFYNGVAAAPFTRNVLRMALSFASPTDLEPFYTEKTLINMAKDAGYETLWISNQGNSGIQDSYLGYLAAGTDKAVFSKGSYLANDDIVLIPMIKEEHKPSGKQFFVIHLVGSHNNYSDRYDLKDVQAIPGENSLLNHYDRSIHHTDRVLHAIYDIMHQDSTALFFHFSDHGEIIGKGHGPWKNGIAQFDIPLITINKHAGNIETVMQKYTQPEKGVINNTNTIFILAEMMGYNIPQKLVEKALSDGQYVRHADQSYSFYSDVKEETE